MIQLSQHNLIDVEAGIATILFRAGEEPGTVTIRAILKDLKPDPSY